MAADSIEGVAPRAAAARAIVAVLGGRNLDTALLEAVRDIDSAPDRALAQALAYGVIRDHALLAALRDRLLQRPQQTPPLLLALLQVGLYQLRSMRMPPYAAVATTVDACATLGQHAARGLVNAVLRRYQREAQTLEASLSGRPALQYSYPDWLAASIRRDWPQQWRELLAIGNQPGPLTLRVNRRRITRGDMLRKLNDAGIAAATLTPAPDALRLDQAQPVEHLPGFAAGLISVQDAAAQLAAPLLDAQSGMRVLDACAAPGGKTAHLLETVDDLDLLALDSDAARLARVDDSLQRLSLQASLRHADAAITSDWWNGRPFDRILLDAPCSGTGVIRRHPDIKWLRRETDIRPLMTRQRSLLDALWPLLAPDGTLLYVTCSILDAEGAAVVAGFLRAHDDAREHPIKADWGEAVRVGRRLAPGGDYDGFYYARLQKTGR